MNKIINTLKLLMVMCMICMPALLFAQPGGFDDDVQDVPFDGGVSLLVAAGIGYGLKKAYQQRKIQKASALYK